MMMQPEEDPYIQALEERIDESHLNGEQKDLMKKLSAVAMEQAETPDDKDKMFKTIMALVQLMESVSTKAVNEEEAASERTIADYIHDLRADPANDEESVDELAAFFEDLMREMAGESEEELSRDEYGLSQGVGTLLESYA